MCKPNSSCVNALLYGQNTGSRHRRIQERTAHWPANPLCLIVCKSNTANPFQTTTNKIKTHLQLVNCIFALALSLLVWNINNVRWSSAIVDMSFTHVRTSQKKFFPLLLPHGASVLTRVCNNEEVGRITHVCYGRNERLFISIICTLFRCLFFLQIVERGRI